jgi:serine/threonine-protein kinase
MANDEQPLRSGRILSGKFLLESRLGSGAMGEVWRARHLPLEKDVALKTIRPDRARSNEVTSRFIREARLTSRLSHKNSVAILDFGRDQSVLYLAMELVEGPTIAEALRTRGRLPFGEAVDIMSQVLAGVAAAHQRGILHRDIKPSNIMLSRDEDDEGQPQLLAKVLDFGLAKLADAADTITGPAGRRLLVGTPMYMSPEQAVGERIDERTDLYACGVVLFELLVGRPPFEGRRPVSVLMKHCASPIPDPTRDVPELPRKVGEVVSRALAKEPRNRFQSAREFRAALLELSRVVPEVEEKRAKPDTSYFLQPRSTGEYPAVPRPPEDEGVLVPMTPDDTLVGSVDRNFLAQSWRSVTSASRVPPASEAPGSVDVRFELPVEATASRAPALEAKGVHGSSLPVEAEASGAPSAVAAGVHGSPLPEPEASGAPSAVAAGVHGSSLPVEAEASGAPSVVAAGVDGSSRAERPGVEARPQGEARTATEPGEPVSSYARFLWERFALSPFRRPPARGFWLADAESNRVGPLSVEELCLALRLEAHDGGLERCRVAADPLPRAWRAVTDLLETIEASGVALLEAPVSSGQSGQLGPLTLSSLLAQASLTAATGRIVVVSSQIARPRFFELHLVDGRPTFVDTNDLALQLPHLLVDQGVLRGDDLPLLVSEAWAHEARLEEVARWMKGVTFETHRPAIMRRRLREMLAVAEGTWVLDRGFPPPDERAFAPSLLSLLPRLIGDALSPEAIEAALIPYLDHRLADLPHVADFAGAWELTPGERAIADEILAASTLEAALPKLAAARRRHALVAYLLVASTFPHLESTHLA